MQWQKPDFIEINMSAEIGGYQDDFEERTPPPVSAQPPTGAVQELTNEKALPDPIDLIDDSSLRIPPHL